MLFIRKRYYAWLVREYVRKWKKSLLFSIFLGAFLFFLFLLFFKFYLQPIAEGKVEKIGVIGAYSVDNLPNFILANLSYGLTNLKDDGRIYPQAAERWEIQDNGKKYIFFLKPGQYFHNGKELTADTIPFNFKDVEKKKLGKYEVEYVLKNSYAPFLSVVSRPILLKGLVGLSDFKLKELSLNAGFVKDIIFQNIHDSRIRKEIYFYPSNEALKIAFALGEINFASGLTDFKIKSTQINLWKNSQTEKTVDYNKLVTLFFDNSDQILSDKKIRQALSYALPDDFKEGKRAYSPIKPISIFYNSQLNFRTNNLEVAKTLLSASSAKNGFNMEISTPYDLLQIAQIIKKAWEELGIKVTIKTFDTIPNTFQALLYYFRVPDDPDQYILWHSDQIDNIANYKNLRIDKLLEDGRTITTVDERVKIYWDFQKYILDDAPAAFLYFPYAYNITRNLK